jgi:UDP-glucose 4-epimerase
MSSVKVNGERSRGAAFTPFDVPNPRGAYASSKWQAEQVVVQTCAASGMEFAIVRPPLIYGPGVRANFLKLMNWVSRGYPLPFAAIRNERSFVSVWNLTDAVVRILSSPAAADRTLMISDGEDLSTAELATRLAAAMQCRARLIAVPDVMLRFAGFVTGTGGTVMQLCDSLRVDLSHTIGLLGWRPPMSVHAALEKTADWFRSTR